MDVMRRVKLRSSLYIIMVCVVCSLSGCSIKPQTYEQQGIVDRMKREYTALEAAQVSVCRLDEQGNYMYTMQAIRYRFVGDIMQYTYYGYDEDTGDNYYEFNNGTELDTHHYGDEGWEFAAKGSKGYYSYSRAKRHYFADGEQLLNDHAGAVSGSGVRKDIYEEGEAYIVLHLDYDNDKLAQYDSMAGMTDMTQEYIWNVSETHEDEETAMGRLCDSMRVSYSKDGERWSYSVGFYGTDPNEPIERRDEEYWYQ